MQQQNPEPPPAPQRSAAPQPPLAAAGTRGSASPRLRHPAGFVACASLTRAPSARTRPLHRRNGNARTSRVPRPTRGRGHRAGADPRRSPDGTTGKESDEASDPTGPTQEKRGANSSPGCAPKLNAQQHSKAWPMIPEMQCGHRGGGRSNTASALLADSN